MTPGPLPDAPIERIRHHLVGLRMPRALEALDAVVQQLERGQVSAIEAIDTLLTEEFTVREGRRIKAALQMARLATIKTITGFDFSFQPSLDRNRIMALATLEFIDRHEIVHLIGQSGTGKSHLAIALGVEAIRAGRSVYFSPFADILDSLAKAEREGRLRERIRYLCRACASASAISAAPRCSSSTRSAISPSAQPPETCSSNWSRIVTHQVCVLCGYDE